MSDYEERKARKKREKLEKKLTQSEGKRQQSQLSRTGSAYFSSAKSPSSDGVVSSQKSDNSSKLKRFTSISSRNLSPSSFRKNAATSSSSLANSNLSTSSSNLASPATERRGGGTSKQGGTSISGAATKKLRRLSASFDPRKGFSMGGSSRTLKMDRSATFTDDEDDSGMSDSEGGPASSEAMLAKYLPFLAPVATKVVAQAMADAQSAAYSSSPSSSTALLSPRAGAGSLPSPRAGFTSGPFGVDEDDDPNLPEGATGEETQDAILSLIESESLGPTFRSVFEQEKEQEFIRTLALFIRGKRKEIENVCNFHYQEFIHSVDELLALRTETGQLKDDIVHLNTQIQATGTSLLDKSQALLELRATHANINAAIEELSRCVFVFHQCEQANRQIKDGQFYKALKARVLGEIEHQSLPQLPQYEFVKFLESKIPALKETIKKYVTDEFNDWLVSMREHAIDIGALAIEQMTAQIKEELRIKQELQETVYKAPESGAQEKEDKKRRRKKDATTPRGRGAAKGSEASRPTTRQESEDDEDVGIFQRVGVTFTPVYKCIHIYENLSSLTEFENYYQYTRQLQAHLVQQGPAGPAFLASRRAYESYFYQITGFFIVEAHVWHTTQNLISPSTVKGWWETAAHRIRAALQEQVTTYCRDVVVLQQLRDFVFLFTRTISAYGYDVTLMQDFFKNMRDKYIDLATQSYREEFLTVMERETFQPLYIADEEEYQLMILDNNLDQIFPHQLRLPMKFPFSAFVPNCVSIVKHFIKTYYEFSKDLFADTDEFVKKGTELLLKVMCSTISKQMMDSSNSNVSSLVQLSLSLPFMKNCCNIFEAYIASFKYELNPIIIVIVVVIIIIMHMKAQRLHMCLNAYLGAEASPLSRSMFDALRENAEKRMFEVIDRKIDELFDNVDINWAPQAPSKEPRDWVGELFLYLQTTLAVFDPLRQELRDEIALEAFNRMAICLRNMVYNNDAKRINRAAIQSLDNDLRYAEGYIRQWNVSSLQDSIQELRQLVNLLLADNLLEFLDERVRRSKYPDLTDIPKLVGVLHKFETETTLGRFSVALGGKASKRQTVETLIRSLSSERSGSSSPSSFLALGRGDK